MNTKKVLFPILALVMVIIATILSTAAVSAQPSWVWGIDPASTGNELVLLDAWTGTKYASFALPTISSSDMELGLAGESAQLYYVNGDVDDSTVYLLDPTDGSTLGTVTLTGGWDVDGLGNYGGFSTGWLYTSGCIEEDLHRYLAAGSGPTFYWSTIDDPKTVGGDDTGRIYTYGQLVDENENGPWVIAEIDPVTEGAAPINTFTSPSEDPVGMAYDGTNLYVSDTSNMLYILDPNNGEVLNSLDLGFTLWALAVTEELPPALIVEKDYRYTNVCFVKDNGPEVDCPYGTLLGDPLERDDGNYIVEAVVKHAKVKSYIPGQYYAVSTVNVLMDVDGLTIEEDWSDCDEISALSPEQGGGSVVIVQVGPDGIAYQILDAKSDEVTVGDCTAIATLGAVSADTTIRMYVKFGPAQKHDDLEEGTCENTNTAWVSIGDWTSEPEEASATLELIEKE